MGLVRYAGGARGEKAADLARRGVGTHDHDGDRRGSGVVAQPLEHLLPSEVREVGVEQDEHGAVLPSELESGGGAPYDSFDAATPEPSVVTR